MKKLQANWHKFMYSYKQMLYYSCLDEQLRDKLRERLTYHEAKLLQYNVL